MRVVKYLTALLITILLALTIWFLGRYAGDKTAPDTMSTDEIVGRYAGDMGDIIDNCQYSVRELKESECDNSDPAIPGCDKAGDCATQEERSYMKAQGAITN
jgi:hypothetical protein